MVSQNHRLSSPKPDELHECGEAIEELIADFGIKGFLQALSETKAAAALPTNHQEATLRVTQVIIREIVFGTNPQLEAEIIALGAGIMLTDDTTMTRIAKKHGITRAAVSKRVVAFCEKNTLPPSIYMRAERDRKTYSETNRREKIPNPL